MLNAEQRSILKLFDLSSRESAITDIVVKLPFIKYPEMSGQCQIIMKKITKMSDFEFGLLKKRL